VVEGLDSVVCEGSDSRGAALRIQDWPAEAGAGAAVDGADADWDGLDGAGAGNAGGSIHSCVTFFLDERMTLMATTEHYIARLQADCPKGQL
jgi:hypothetical protein